MGWGFSMKACQPGITGSYDPGQLKALVDAFDNAWARLAPSVGNSYLATEMARITLADVVLSLAKHGNFDPQWLADSALAMMVARASESTP
jgi:hypothetical protein